MSKLILMRHGQSEWNLLNLFTGWVDVPLSEKGLQEAIDGGKVIKDIPIDVIFTSSLIRAQMTAMLAMMQHSSKRVPVILHPHQGKMEKWAKIYGDEAKKNSVPVHCAWELNERMYGELQGMNKAETMEKFGQDQVKIWRRSFDVPPPHGESLKMTAERSIPYFQQKILPHLEKGESVFVAAHGNSLRSIIMFLDNLSKEEVLNLELATGLPVVYDFTQGSFTKATL